jgi:hypothetical protein
MQWPICKSLLYVLKQDIIQSYSYNRVRSLLIIIIWSASRILEFLTNICRAEKAGVNCMECKAS